MSDAFDAFDALSNAVALLLGVCTLLACAALVLVVAALWRRLP